MVSLKELGERELIRNIRNIIRQSPGLGPGDDAALIPPIKGDVVACVDTVSFERHRPQGMTCEDLGWMAAAVSLSDLASMGASPKGLLASLLMPEDMDESSVYDIMMGMDNCASSFDTYIYGGDTKPGCGSVSCTAIGSLNGRSPMLRSGARPGDVVAVTGSLGSAAAGFFSVEKGITGTDLSPLMRPTPRIDEGIAISTSGAVTSCIDLSDGLAEGARIICDSSHVGMDIHSDFIPEGDHVDRVSTELDIPKDDLLLYWGGDYELLFTFDKGKMERLYEQDVEFSVIGKVTNDDAPYINKNGSRTVMRNGRY